MNPPWKKLLLALLAVGLLALAGAGCQTVRGLGEDVENLGESMQDD